MHSGVVVALVAYLYAPIFFKLAVDLVSMSRNRTCSMAMSSRIAEVWGIGACMGSHIPIDTWLDFEVDDMATDTDTVPAADCSFFNVDRPEFAAAMQARSFGEHSHRGS